MIVRLKEYEHKIYKDISCMFQFYDSPIKRQIGVKYTKWNIGFNSMIVRLKAVASGPLAYLTGVSIL